MQRFPVQQRQPGDGMRKPMIAGALVVALVTAGCASTSGGSSSGTTPQRRGNSTLITESEIASANLETIYDVIERLRPNMLRTRGQVGRLSGASEGDAGAQNSRIRVYLNGSSVGDLTMLRSIQASSIREVQYLSATDATTRFGTGHDAGAILLTSK
jgi:hypothetical protein